MTTQPLNVGIIYNAFEPALGRTDERLSEESVAEVAKGVAEAVIHLGHRASLIPLQRSLLNFLHRIKDENLDVLVNLCEGYYGRPQWESNVAAALELIGVPFTGNPFRTLAICQDKFRTKAVLNFHNLPTAPSLVISSPDQPAEILLPAIVKPNMEDASLGIRPDSVVYDRESLSQQVKKVLDMYKQPALVEKYIDGREFNVAILDNKEKIALPVSEIDFSTMPESTPRICSYEAKWFQDDILCKTTIPLCPAPIEDDLREHIQKTALAAFEAMGCRDYARVDFRMDKQGNLFILEVNPNPDISLDAGYVRALKAAGIAYEKFWAGMLAKALDRREIHASTNGTSR